MSTVEQANKINKDIGRKWIDSSFSEKSEFVINWCRDNDIQTELSVVNLAAAMNVMPYWSQGPDNYLDFVIAFNAASKPFIAKNK